MMGYLKLRRSQLILASFLVFSLILAVFPGIDLSISRLFFDGKSFQHNQVHDFLHESMGVFLVASVGSVLALCIFNRVANQRVCNVCMKRVLYLFLVLVIGAGLIVNVLLKDNFGRARPRDVTQFGGLMHFTPPFVMSNECNRNCSFASGEAAGGFFSLALALALSRRRRAYVAALAVGAVFSWSRISQGAHFFSDTVVSFFVMLIVADVLYYYLVMTHTERADLPVPALALQARSRAL